MCTVPSAEADFLTIKKKKKKKPKGRLLAKGSPRPSFRSGTRLDRAFLLFFQNVGLGKQLAWGNGLPIWIVSCSSAVPFLDVFLVYFWIQLQKLSSWEKLWSGSGTKDPFQLTGEKNPSWWSGQAPHQYWWRRGGGVVGWRVGGERKGKGKDFILCKSSLQEQKNSREASFHGKHAFVVLWRESVRKVLLKTKCLDCAANLLFYFHW